VLFIPSLQMHSQTPTQPPTPSTEHGQIGNLKACPEWLDEIDDPAIRRKLEEVLEVLYGPTQSTTPEPNCEVETRTELSSESRNDSEQRQGTPSTSTTLKTERMFRREPMRLR
jgi:hypothetical protein